jgi:hypothetical protein
VHSTEAANLDLRQSQDGAAGYACAKSGWFRDAVPGTVRILKPRMKAKRHSTLRKQLSALSQLALAGVMLCGVVTAHGDDFQGATHLMPFDEETINYSKQKDTGPIAQLQAQIDRGDVSLKFSDRFGYLLDLLKTLNVSTNSQMLVFSKTSFQRERIAPRTPRSVFFNDDVYIGFVQGSSLLEISSVDPKLGGVFYTLEQTKTDKPRFVRTDQCLECHASAKTMGVPGHLVRSFATDENGVVDMTTGVSLVNHRTPIEERWGGWFVTGNSGKQSHRGNLFGKAAFARNEKEPGYLAHQTDLKKFFDVAEWPTGSSDIVALMVMEHQSHMHNFLTRLNYEATIALQQYGHTRYLKNIIESFVRYLLFVEEAPFASPIRGNTAFAEDFTKLGPRDEKGRTLREFDLQTRLFKYPCSYLIYSDAFDQLPAKLKERIYTRLLEVLSGEDTSEAYAKLSTESRTAIREILGATKKDLPASWRD